STPGWSLTGHPSGVKSMPARPSHSTNHRTTVAPASAASSSARRIGAASCPVRPPMRHALVPKSQPYRRHGRLTPTLKGSGRTSPPGGASQREGERLGSTPADGLRIASARELVKEANNLRLTLVQ